MQSFNDLICFLTPPSCLDLLESELLGHVQGRPTYKLDHDQNHQYITVDVPGYEAEELSVEIDGRAVVISGRHQMTDTDGKVWENNNFELIFDVSNDIDLENVPADLKNGQLTVTMYKVPSVPVRKIEIKKL